MKHLCITCRRDRDTCGIYPPDKEPEHKTGYENDYSEDMVIDCELYQERTAKEPIKPSDYMLEFSNNNREIYYYFNGIRTESNWNIKKLMKPKEY